MKEKDPGSAFGPEPVPLATGSVSVVYWVPGPFSTPNPLSSRICAAGPPQPLASHVGLGTSLSVRLACPVLDCAETYR